jgi:hypothetical protein
MARYLGLVRIEDIIDRKNPDPHVNARYDWEYWQRPSFSIDVPELADPYVWTYGYDTPNAQPYHLEVWCEKSTMDDVLLPVCARLGANLVTFEGEVSITAVCVGLVKRIAASQGKPARIWYISDFDPAGNSMPVATARKLEWAIRAGGWSDLDVRLTPLALSADQVRAYRLPRKPIKDTERRAARFEDAFGAGATELDALEVLHPGELTRLVESALSPYYDQEAARAVRAQDQALKAAVRQEIDAITARYQDEIDALQTMIADLRAVTVDTSAYTCAIATPIAPESDGWLFDSARDYLSQIAHYKAHKSGTTEEQSHV